MIEHDKIQTVIQIFHYIFGMCIVVVVSDFDDDLNVVFK